MKTMKIVVINRTAANPTMSDDCERYSFPKTHHLRKPSEFSAVYARKMRAGDHCLLVFVAPNECDHCRLGMSVSKRTHGHAVRRNRMRRLLREAFRLEQHNLPEGLDIVVVPRPQQSLENLLPTFRKSLKRLTKKLAKRFNEQ